MGWNHRRKRIIENIEDVDVELRLRMIEIPEEEALRTLQRVTMVVPTTMGGGRGLNGFNKMLASQLVKMKPCVELWMDFYLEDKKFLSKKATDAVTIESVRALEPSFDFDKWQLGEKSPTKTIRCSLAEILTCGSNSIRDLAKEILENFKNGKDTRS